jgi:hypothetical protein
MKNVSLRSACVSGQPATGMKKRAESDFVPKIRAIHPEGPAAAQSDLYG